MTKRAQIIQEILAERLYQDNKYSERSDDTRTQKSSWNYLIRAYAEDLNCGVPNVIRKRLIQIAALSISAIESLDRHD